MSEYKIKAVKDVMIEQLAKFGVKNIYGYTGDTILEFFAALKDSPIKLYTSTHEGTAGLMASAESKLTGNISVCTVHSGPGTANVINGIADAYSDQVPVLLISGQVPSKNIGTDYKQFVSQQKLTEPLIVYSTILSNPEAVVDVMYKAMTKAITRGGVSHLVIPKDMWSMPTSAIPRDYPVHFLEKKKPEQGLIKEAVEKIKQSSKPVILYGRGAKDCRDQLLEFADRTNAALINSLPVAHMIEFDNPHTLGCLGLAGSEEAALVVNEADLIIILGATWWPEDYSPKRPDVIQVDVVEENIGSTHPVDIGIVGDIQLTLNILLEQLSQLDKRPWGDKIEQARSKWLSRLEEETKGEEYPIKPQAIIKHISEVTGPEEIITLDSGDNVIWFGRYFGNRCRDILVSGSWRTMGFSLPAAIVAKINNPDTEVTAITGDGGIKMVLAEITTAIRYNLPIRIVILNNGTLAMEKNRLIAADLPAEEVDLTNPDFVKLAEACGVEGVRANNRSELHRILQETKSIEKPFVIDVPTGVPIPAGTKL